MEEGQREGVVVVDVAVVELDLPFILVLVSPQDYSLFPGVEIHILSADGDIQITRSLAEGDDGAHVLSGCLPRGDINILGNGQAAELGDLLHYIKCSIGAVSGEVPSVVCVLQSGRERPGLAQIHIAAVE